MYGYVLSCYNLKVVNGSVPASPRFSADKKLYRSDSNTLNLEPPKWIIGWTWTFYVIIWHRDAGTQIQVHFYGGANRNSDREGQTRLAVVPCKC
jgi:hypothetical protein